METEPQASEHANHITGSIQNSPDSTITPIVDNGKPWDDCESMVDSETLDTSNLIDFPPLCAQASKDLP